jgi:hypothetical protein
MKTNYIFSSCDNVAFVRGKVISAHIKLALNLFGEHGNSHRVIVPRFKS